MSKLNINDSTFTERNGSIFLDMGFFLLPVPETVKKAVVKRATSSEVKVGIRTRDISLGKRRSSSPFKALVYGIQPLGDEKLLI